MPTCFFVCRMNCESTSLQLGHSGKEGLVARKAASSKFADWRAISMEVSVAGTTRRVFEALTTPEYLEAWFSIPGCHSGCRATASHRVDGFLLQHYCGAGSVTTVSGSYSVFLRRKLIFSWQMSGVVNTTESVVDIRLCGDFERSTLRLRHNGLRSDEEFSWHTDLWTASLARLNRLLGGDTNGPRPHGLRGRQRNPQTPGAEFLEPTDQRFIKM